MRGHRASANDEAAEERGAADHRAQHQDQRHLHRERQQHPEAAVGRVSNGGERVAERQGGGSDDQQQDDGRRRRVGDQGAEALCEPRDAIGRVPLQRASRLLLRCRSIYFPSKSAFRREVGLFLHLGEKRLETRILADRIQVGIAREQRIAGKPGLGRFPQRLDGLLGTSHLRPRARGEIRGVMRGIDRLPLRDLLDQRLCLEGLGLRQQHRLDAGQRAARVVGVFA